MIRGIAIVMILLGTALSGCSPKRVTSTGVVTTPPETESETKPQSTSRAPETTSEPALPAPKPFSRSGESAQVASRPESTTKSKPSELGPRAVKLAKDQLGKPYQWGAAGPNKFDCSGLVQYIYSNLGVALPRVSGQQAGSGVHVDRSDLQPGDLVFFRLSGTRIDHVGIYVGKGKFIHAPRKHNPVRMDSLNNSWWRRKFKGGRRVG